MSLSYANLRDSLARSTVAVAPSELHGNVCGILCSGGETAAERWVEECVSEHAAGDEQSSSDLRNTLAELVHETHLGSEAFDFEPLLPDDDAELADRVQALAAYCHGFLEGLALGGAAQAHRAAEGELGEILTDFAEISRAGLDASEEADPEQADFAFAELTEYVRVGVELAYEELSTRRTTAAPRSDSLH